MYFSLRSPYSWLAFLKLRGSASPLWSMDRWSPFWQPESASLKERLEVAGAELIYSPMPLSKIFYSMMDIRRHAESLGIEVTRPKESRDGWDAPHLAFLAARAAGDGERFLEAVFAARWEKGWDICQREVLDEIVAATGGHGSWMSDAVLETAAEGLFHAWQDKVFGVPYFVLGGKGYWGIHRLEAAAGPDARHYPGEDDDEDMALDGIPMEIIQAPGCLDRDHAGGCG